MRKLRNLDRIKEQLIDLINNEYIYVKSSDFENPSSLADMQPAVLLYQTGYLTLAAPSNKLEYQLTYPNEEVKQALTIQLASQVFSNESEFRKLRRSPLDDMQTVDEIVDYFNSILNLVDYEYYPLTSESAVINSIMLFLKGQDKLKVAVNSHSSKGRCDLQVDSDARRLVFEFKFAIIDDDVSELLQKACTQLQDRRYGQSADAKGEILQIALVFSQEQRCITAFEKI